MRIRNIFFIAFTALSLFATIKKENLYPINAYRMFSKNWLKQQTIPGVEVSEGEQTIALWKNSDVPFFQVNNTAIEVYYKRGLGKEQFCQWVRSNLGANKITLYGVERKYERVQGKIEDSIKFKEKVYECSQI